MAAAELNNTVLKNSANLKAYYRFESGALTTDSSGNAHTLTAISDPAEDTGVYGGGVTFDSNDAYSHADNADLKPTGAFTVGAWVKRSATGAYAFIFQSFKQSTNFGGIQFGFTNANAAYFVIGITSGTLNTCSSTATFTDGVWHHFVGTSDGTTMRLYVDGKHVASAASGHPTYFTDTYIRVGCGNYSGTDTDFLNGLLDEVFLLNGTALSADQIKELYEGRFIGEAWPQAGLVAGYHLSSETDFSGNNYHLTNNASTAFIGGKFKNCTSFNGSTQSLSINSSYGIDGGAISISAWIKPTTVTSALDHLSYVALYGNTTKTSYNLFVGTTGIGATRLRAGVAWDETAQVAITASVWTHAVLTYDTTNLKLYINGNLRDIKSCSGNGSGSATSKATLGCRADADSLTGQIATSLDEVLFYNRALTAQEIRKMYAVGTGRLQ